MITPNSLLPQRPANLLLFAVLASALALALAFISEYGFHLHPCQMCYWQRIPYAVIIVAGAMSWLLRSRFPAFLRMTLWLILLLFATNAGLSGFHAGVEWRWWEGPGACSGGIDGNMSLEEIRAKLLGAASVSCSDAAVRVAGLSMAGWNMLYSLACGIVVMLGLNMQRRKTDGSPQ